MAQLEDRAGARGSDLARLILGRFTSGEDLPGERLPTERRLADELGVSRTAVRHALALLESEGRVSREVGRGTFLAAPAQGEAMSGVLLADDVGPGDVMAARHLVEPQILSLVVAWATTRDFEEMERCLVGGDNAESAEEFEAWDMALHHGIVVASHNQLVVRMYSAVEAARNGQLWGSLKRRNDSLQRRAERQDEHRALVEALRARELDTAVKAARYHLERVEVSLLGP